MTKTIRELQSLEQGLQTRAYNRKQVSITDVDVFLSQVKRFEDMRTVDFNSIFHQHVDMSFRQDFKQLIEEPHVTAQAIIKFLQRANGATCHHLLIELSA